MSEQTKYIIMLCVLAGIIALLSIPTIATPERSLREEYIAPECMTYYDFSRMYPERKSEWRLRAYMKIECGGKG